MAKTQTIENEFVKVPDFTQFQAEFSKWAGDFGKYFVNGKAPSFDFDAVFALQRKNVEAFTAANQLAFDGVKAVAQRQAEIARKAFEEFGKVTKELTAAGTPEDKFAKQADLAKTRVRRRARQHARDRRHPAEVAERSGRRADQARRRQLRRSQGGRRQDREEVKRLLSSKPEKVSPSPKSADLLKLTARCSPRSGRFFFVGAALNSLGESV